MKSRHLYTYLICFALFGWIAWTIYHASIRARDLDVRLNCSANLRAIGQAIHQYAASDISGAFPDDPSRLILANELQTRCQCPSVFESRPSYFYVGGLSRHSPATTVVLFEESRNHLGEIGSVLFADGSVKSIREPDLRAMIDAAIATGKVVPVPDLSLTQPSN